MSDINESLYPSGFQDRRGWSFFALKLDATTLSALFISGQIVESLMPGHFGAIGLNTHEINLQRIFDVLLSFDKTGESHL